MPTLACHATPTQVLLDPVGTLGRLYGASTTPDIFVAMMAGVLAAAGGADSIASTDLADFAAMAGRDGAHAVTRPYGCSVKYAA